MKDGKLQNGYDRLKIKYEKLQESYLDEVKKHAVTHDECEKLNAAIASLVKTNTEVINERDALEVKVQNLTSELVKLDSAERDFLAALSRNEKLAHDLIDANAFIKALHSKLDAYWRHMGWFRRWTWRLKHKD